MRDRQRTIQLKWETAYAGDEPIVRYEIWRDNQKTGQVAHKPQINRAPFVFKETLSDKAAHSYRIATVDTAGRTTKTEDLLAIAL
jgi:signal recognition particle GTPase